jgi:HSP20 family molecular chaperone IbpA
MANEQSKRQGERQQSSAGSSTAMERADSGERGLTTRQYQDPFSLFDSLFERMQRDFFGTSLLNALVPARGGDGDGRQFVRMPRVQMRDTGDALELKAEMPGIDGRNVSVVLEDGVLTISGEQREEHEEGDVRAERRDGVLAVRFPKTRARSNAREIPVTTQQQGQQTGQQQQQSTKERAA